MLKLLLDNGADTEVKDGSGRTALSHAAVSGRPDVAACLLDRGADLEAMDNTGKTPLVTAVKSGKVDVVRLFLRRGANIDARVKGRGVKDFVQHEACRSVLDEEAECLQRWHRRRTLVLWRQ